MAPSDTPRGTPRSGAVADPLPHPADASGPRIHPAAASRAAGPRSSRPGTAPAPTAARPPHPARSVPIAVTAHLLLIDQTGRILLQQAANGRWGLPATELRFDVSPQRHVVAFAGRDLGIEIAERDLLLAHVNAHRTTERGTVRLVFSVGVWNGEPAQSAWRQWASPGKPPERMATWDAQALPVLLTFTPYTEIGWASPDWPVLP